MTGSVSDSKYNNDNTENSETKPTSVNYVVYLARLILSQCDKTKKIINTTKNLI